MLWHPAYLLRNEMRARARANGVVSAAWQDIAIHSCRIARVGSARILGIGFDAGAAIVIGIGPLGREVPV